MNKFAGLRRIIRAALTPFHFTLSCALLICGTAAAQSMTAESGTTAVAGNTISMTRIPVTNSTGRVQLNDIQIQFAIDSAGTVTIATGFPRVTRSPATPSGGFRAGTYQDTGTGARFLVTGPSALPGGRTSWGLQQISPTNRLFEASWATGAVAGHPFQAQLNRHGITNTLYTWGVVGRSNSGVIFQINVNEVIGAQQNGNQLVLHLYDTATSPVETGTVTLTLCSTPTC